MPHYTPMRLVFSSVQVKVQLSTKIQWKVSLP